MSRTIGLLYPVKVIKEEEIKEDKNINIIESEKTEEPEKVQKKKTTRKPKTEGGR